MGAKVRISSVSSPESFYLGSSISEVKGESSLSSFEARRDEGACCSVSKSNWEGENNDQPTWTVTLTPWQTYGKFT